MKSNAINQEYFGTEKFKVIINFFIWRQHRFRIDAMTGLRENFKFRDAIPKFSISNASDNSFSK